MTNEKILEYVMDIPELKERVIELAYEDAYWQAHEILEKAPAGTSYSFNERGEHFNFNDCTAIEDVIEYCDFLQTSFCFADAFNQHLDVLHKYGVIAENMQDGYIIAKAEDEKYLVDKCTDAIRSIEKCIFDFISEIYDYVYDEEHLAFLASETEGLFDDISIVDGEIIKTTVSILGTIY